MAGETGTPPRPARSAALGAALILAGCAGGRPTPGPSLAAGAEAEGRDADRAMAAAVAAHDPEAFAGHLAPDALFFGARGPAAGRAAVLAGWAGLLAEGAPLLAWAPDRAEAAPAGDLVFTWGGWSQPRPGAGPPATGRYLTVWQRGADGLLRAVMDAGDRPLPPLPPGVTARPLRTLASRDGVLLAECGLLVDPAEGSPREIGHYLRLSRLGPAGLVQLSEAGALWPPP